MENRRFASAFYMALKDTIVCENLDIANRIAYGQPRYRCVTLGGELIEKSGVMSGGGRPKYGGMGRR